MGKTGIRNNISINNNTTNGERHPRKSIFAIIKSFLSKGGFIHNVLLLMSGTALAQLIAFASSPVLTRLYKPDALGLFAIYTAIFTIIGSNSMGRYELAIVLPKNDSRSKDLIQLCVILAGIVSLITLLVIGLLNQSIALKLGFQDNQKLLLFVPISVFLAAGIIAQNFLKIRKKMFRSLSIANVLQSSSSVTLQVLFALFLSPLAIVLIVGQILGQMTAIAYLLFTNRILRRVHPIHSLITRIYAVGRKYKNFPRQMLFAGFINQLTVYLPILILGWRYSATVVGLFALSLRAIQAPMSVIGQSIGNTFMSRASELVKSDPHYLKKRSYHMVIVLSIIGVIPALILIFWGPPLFERVFGSQWREAGVYSQILAFYLLIRFTINPLSMLFIVLERQKLYQIWVWIRFSLTGLALLFGTTFYQPYGTLVLLTLAMVFSYLVLGYFSFYILKLKCSS